MSVENQNFGFLKKNFLVNIFGADGGTRTRDGVTSFSSAISLSFAKPLCSRKVAPFPTNTPVFSGTPSSTGRSHFCHKTTPPRTFFGPHHQQVAPTSVTKQHHPELSFFGADGGTRTRDLLITNQLLYQLSHISIPVHKHAYFWFYLCLFSFKKFIDFSTFSAILIL